MKHKSHVSALWFSLPLLVMLVVLTMLAVAPVPRPSPSNTVRREGRVESIRATDSQDLQIRIVGDARTYYVNRGVEAGLREETLRQQLEGRTIQMDVVKRSWSPLDPLHRLAPIGRLEEDGIVIFSAWE